MSYRSTRWMTFTLATENTRKCYQAPFPIFRMGPGNGASTYRCSSHHVQNSYKLELICKPTTRFWLHLVARKKLCHPIEFCSLISLLSSHSCNQCCKTTVSTCWRYTEVISSSPGPRPVMKSEAGPGNEAKVRCI